MHSHNSNRMLRRRSQTLNNSGFLLVLHCQMLAPAATLDVGASVPYHKADISKYMSQNPWTKPKDPTVIDVRFWDHT